MERIPDEEPAAEADAYLRRVEANVTRAGLHLTDVAGDAGDLFTYTAGLTGTDHPELVVAGLPPDIAHMLLAKAVLLIRAGTRLVPGRDFEGIAVGLPVRFRTVDQATCRHPLSVTTLFYGEEVPALQLVWTDPQGRFPGDPDCAPVIAAAQEIC